MSSDYTNDYRNACADAMQGMMTMVKVYGVGRVLCALDRALHAEAHPCPSDCGGRPAVADHLDKSLFIVRKE